MVVNIVLCVLLLIASFSVIIIGWTFASDMLMTSPGPLNEFTTAHFYGILCIGLFTILVSFCGIGTSRIPNKGLTIGYGVMILPAFIGMTILAVSLHAVVEEVIAAPGLTPFC